MKRLLFTLTLVGLLAAACGSPGVSDLPTTEPTSTQPAPTTTPVPPTTLPPTSTHIPVDTPPAQRAAVQALAAALGLSVDQIKLVSIEAVDWPDGCLGVRRVGVLCTQVITPGFRIVLEANGKQYEYHTSADGSVVIPAESPVVASEIQQAAALQALARMLGMAASDITVVSSAAVDWHDACLGIAQPGIVCAQVVMPGFIIVLEARGRQYEYHTNADASAVRPATLALTWHREGGIAGFCDDLTVYLSGEIQASSCRPGGKAADASLRVIASKEELAQFDKWITLFGAVTVTMKDAAVADAMTMTLTLNGSGKGQPTNAEKQAMIDWAQAVYNRLKP
ncbi:MAG: hypothetical protein HW418_923, partial [Anaerolineales bacterium]|nr:hypothetical protein [Anaerolineales bacterium]